MIINEENREMNAMLLRMTKGGLYYLAFDETNKNENNQRTARTVDMIIMKLENIELIELINALCAE